MRSDPSILPFESRAVSPIVAAFMMIVSLCVTAAFAQPSASDETKAQSWIARAYLPDDETRLGEVRVSEIDGGLQIRTLLYSNLLKRIVAEIEVKCEEGWPDGSRYRSESRRYVGTLQAAREKVWTRWRDLSNRDRARSTQALIIDFVVTDDRAEIEVGVPKLSTGASERSVTGIERLGDEIYPSRFVHAEAVRILEDQFPARATELIAMLPTPDE